MWFNREWNEWSTCTIYYDLIIFAAPIECCLCITITIKSYLRSHFSSSYLLSFSSANTKLSLSLLRVFSTHSLSHICKQTNRQNHIYITSTHSTCLLWNLIFSYHMLWLPFSRSPSALSHTLMSPLMVIVMTCSNLIAFHLSDEHDLSLWLILLTSIINYYYCTLNWNDSIFISKLSTTINYQYFLLYSIHQFNSFHSHLFSLSIISIFHFVILYFISLAFTLSKMLNWWYYWLLLIILLIFTVENTFFSQSMFDLYLIW
jgi:hypothetical protein